MSEETRPLWGVILGIIIILVVGTLFIYGQRQRIAEDQALQEEQPEEIEEVVEPLIIGAIVPLSGSEEERGVAIQKAALMALKEINETGGINGRPVTLLWKDGQCQGSAAVTAAQELVTIDDVDYILGGICNEEAKSIIPIIIQHQTVFISPSATDPELSTLGGSFFFRTALSDTLWARAAADYATKTGETKKAAIIYQTSNEMQQLRAVFSATFKDAGGDIVLDVLSPELTEESLEDSQALSDKAAESLAKEIMEAEVDVVFAINDISSAATLIFALNKIKYEGLIITTESVVIAGLTPPARAEDEADAPELDIEPWEGVLIIKSFFDPTHREFQNFLALYRNQSNAEAPFPQEMAGMYSGLYLLKQALENVDDNPVQVRDYIANTRNWNHALGNLTFDENGDRLGTFDVLQIKEGKLKKVGVQDTSKR